MRRRSNHRAGPWTDEQTDLARRAGRGDRAAAEQFVALTAVDVWRLCAHLVDADSADDLVQSTYERALPALRRFRGDSSAKTWLLTIARRVCADEIRTRTRRRRSESQLVASRSVGVSVVDGSDQRALEALLGELSADRREAFVLTQMVGLRYDEAAEVLGCAIGTIRSRVARARADLQEKLGEMEEGEAEQMVQR